jgi:pantoate kinase
MASTPEAKVKEKIKKILKEHGVYYAMPMGTGYGNSGVPDFLCCVSGKFLAIEAKAGKGIPTALQEKNLRDIKAAGGLAMVVNENNIEELKEVIVREMPVGAFLKLTKEQK